MIQIRKFFNRGDADHGWLKSKHTFSFADYHDEEHMGFSVLRVINEDRIEGGTGFGAHGHQDMEIISYVIEGALEHKDSMGTDTVIRPGEVQRMSAGTGVRHSEHNHLKDQVTHFLQIWILPEKKGTPSSYAQKSFAEHFAKNELVLVASRDGRNDSIVINQDVDMYAAKTERAGSSTINTTSPRRFWVQVIRGDVSVNSTALISGDGAGITGESSVHMEWAPHSEFIVFNLP